MRLFIAINLPEEVKNKIAEAVEKIKPIFNNEIPVRFLSPKNWHLTIVFLGYQPNETLNPILKSIQETAASFRPVPIAFEKIIYGPPGKPARMIWLNGTKKTSQILGELKTKLEDALIENRVKFKRENRLFNAHITLARFQFQYKEVQLPKIDCYFEAETLDLMESRLKRTGAEYEVISQFAFKPPVL